LKIRAVEAKSKERNTPSSAKPLKRSLSVWFFVVAILISYLAGLHADLTVVVESNEMDSVQAEEVIEEMGAGIVVSKSESRLWKFENGDTGDLKGGEREIVKVIPEDGAGEPVYYDLKVLSHRGIWSLFPAFVTIVLCFINREPITALSGGIISGALVLGLFNINERVLLPGLASSGAGLVILLYLFFLGGLLGLWSRNGGALAFAEWVTKRFVRGPKTAKLSAWFLGIFFFQGGTISTLLVGTTVKPIADKERVSHEELSYIVDSTASPIAVLLPFNAWPFYVQGLIYVGGVGVLATEADRIGFFFGSIYLYFYAILAVLFTFLMSIDRLPIISPYFRSAIRRARETGQLDRPDARPLQSSQTSEVSVPIRYKPVAWEFFLPVVLIIGIAVGTYLINDSPDVLSGFGIAVLVSFLASRFRGMPLRDLMNGFQAGLQGVVGGAVVLLLAVVIAQLSKETGGGLFLVEAIGDSVPYWIVPALLFFVTFSIAFATGTSWGTFAVALPLVMPLAWAIAEASGLGAPVFFLQICFAAVINGSVFGDQCSPISDTSILSSLATGCDLMDHIRTQILPCSVAGILAVIGWTVITFIAA